MYYSIAIYPHRGEADESAHWREYMDRAVRQGFTEVFLSLHLPEFTLPEQLALLEELALAAAERGMSLMVDVGGRQLKELLEDKSCSERIRRTGIDFVRLDYGFSLGQVRRIWTDWQVRGIVINASIFGREESARLKREFTEISPKLELRACHNYYPRPESGLSYEFFVSQNRMFKELGIPVYSCIPDREHPRGPIGEGLVTVEEHRNRSLSQIVRQLAASPGNEGLMAADEYFSEEKLALIRRTAEAQRQGARAETLHICWESGVSEEEKQILCGRTHHIRYDSNDCLLRSQSSREMSEYAGRIAPRKTGPRQRGMVTIDNQRYGRYSGEVQIVLRDLPEDERVNRLGFIAGQDLWKLEYYREGVDYRFEPAGELRTLKGSDTREIVRLWNRNLPYRFIDEEEWAAVVLADENMDPELCLAVEEEGRLRGFAVGMTRRYPYLERGREEERAWILALVVDKPFRGKGIGGCLLRRLEEAFERRGAARVTVAACSPDYFTAGVHAGETEAMAWLERRGYARGEAAYWMERDLRGYAMPADLVARRERLERDGFLFIPYESAWAGQLLEFLRENFSTGWRVHVMRAMQLKRLEDRCILCCRDGRVVGYVQRGAGGDENRFGPFGVAADCRNHGLGAVLLHLMWESMAAAGESGVYFRSTEENGRRLYERHGMYVKETYYHYEKKVEPACSQAEDRP